MNYQLGKYFCILNLSLYFPWKVRKQRIWLKLGRMVESLASFLKIATFLWLTAAAEFMLLHPVPMTLGSLVAQLVKNLHACRRPGFDPWVGKSPWRRKWPPTPVLLLGEFHGQRSWAGYSPWDRKESDTTGWLTLTFTFNQYLTPTLLTYLSLHYRL